MRKFQYERLLALLQTMLQAQQANLFAHCQEAAAAIGQSIENSEGNGTRTVALLEDYCELLYRANSGETGQPALQECWDSIRDSFVRELKPNRVEMLFLSHKASMSDCLETIYLAAKADPDCDAFWMPIPYYERSADGELGVWHYEGAEYYSQNIDCTDYRQYDIATRRPDVIFTFAPYDEVNYVTSVHPDHYCRRLQELTDCLVYVPYFVAANLPQEQFCILPGCLFAHKVFLQSENMRDYYLHIYEKAYKKRFGAAKGKFIAMGSPKYDKVILARREDYELPKAWREMMCGADGAAKKIVLYNTTLASMLTGGEQYLQKLRFVIDTFRQSESALLWWRPHPLIENTLLVLRPELLAEYEKIVAEYRQRSYGIYDDTSDPHCAIAWSDAYYGDGASMLAMYLASGKPALLQDIDTAQRHVPNPVFTCFYDDGESLWFTEQNTNALMKLSKGVWDVEWVGQLSLRAGAAAGPNLYGNPVMCDGTIYVVPNEADSIARINPATGDVAHIPVPGLPGGHIASKFANAVVYKKFVYFVPFAFPAIMRLNTATNEVTLHDGWLKPLMERTGDTPDAFFRQPTVVGSSLWLAACSSNAVLEFDMETGAHCLHTVGKAGYTYSGLCYDGEHLWLGPRGGTPLVKWNPKTGQSTEFPGLALGNKEKPYPFCAPVFYKGMVWLIPRYAEFAMTIETRTHVVSVVDGFEADCLLMRDWQGWKYAWAQVSGESLYTYNWMERALVEYNCQTRTWRKEALIHPPQANAQFNEMAARALCREESEIKTEADCVYHEDADTRLEDYLRYLAGYAEKDGQKAVAKRRMEVLSLQNENMDGTAGRKIYAATKQYALG